MITEHSDIFTENYRIFNLPPMASLQGSESDQCTKMDAHSEGRDPPSPPRIFNGGGDAHRVKRDAHPSLPYEHPSPPYVPVTPYEQLKFPRVINPDSPLNDSRQLDCTHTHTF